MAAWQSMRVTVILGDDEIDRAGAFEAFTRGETWNGWLVPYFTVAEGQKIASWTELAAASSGNPESQDIVRWDEPLKAFVIETRIYPDDPEVIQGHHIEELDRTLYPIGGYRWSWEPA